MFRVTSFQWKTPAALIGAVVALTLASTSLHAGTELDAHVSAEDANDTAAAEAIEAPTDLEAERFPERAAIRPDREGDRQGPIAAGYRRGGGVESRYDSSVIGRVGEIGVMQVRPETAAMLGFKGTLAELAKPEINIHYGVIYLSKAWRMAQGDLCRALMKYRAGHGEETMTARSVIYCNRARDRLVAMNSPFAAPGAVAAMPSVSEPAVVSAAQPKPPQAAPIQPTAVWSGHKRRKPFEAPRLYVFGTQA